MNRRVLRGGAVLVAVVLLVPVASAFVADRFQETQTERVEAVSGPDRDGYTAITTQAFKRSYPDAELVVLSPNGSTVHANDRYSSYFDVDPVPDRPDVVEYVAASHLSGDDCGAAAACTREVFVRENFRTGESTVLWSRISPGEHSTRIHDVDRVNGSRIAVADIYSDQVFVYDLERGVRVWTWDAQRDFPLSGGGPFPADWTHLNDVEVLADGTLMVSLRNQDSVVFLARNGTLRAERTLGSDGDHDTLYEQHNPDYLPGSPPAVVVGDSENNRVVEYEWTGESWTATWGWRDDRVQWPRDADRLPNGHTLVTDSNGDRVVEVNRSGAVVWSVEVGLPYEAERLSTGDESAGGPTASEAGLRSHLRPGPGDGSGEGGERVWTVRSFANAVLPAGVVQGVAFVLPPWMAFWHAPLVGLVLVDVAVWGWLEYRHSTWRVRPPAVVRR